MAAIPKITDEEHMLFEAVYDAEDLLQYWRLENFTAALDTVQELMDKLKYIQAILEEKM